MIRRPPRSTQSRSSAASDVYKRQVISLLENADLDFIRFKEIYTLNLSDKNINYFLIPVSYTHLRAHETVLDLVCRLLLEKKKKNHIFNSPPHDYT